MKKIIITIVTIILMMNVCYATVADLSGYTQKEKNEITVESGKMRGWFNCRVDDAVEYYLSTHPNQIIHVAGYWSIDEETKDGLILIIGMDGDMRYGELYSDKLDPRF